MTTNRTPQPNEAAAVLPLAAAIFAAPVAAILHRAQADAWAKGREFPVSKESPQALAARLRKRDAERALAASMARHPAGKLRTGNLHRIFTGSAGA